MITLHQLNDELTFPSVHLALEEPNGLLAFGGDLSPERLSAAYYEGIFPWFSQGEPILWWSPEPRGILPLAHYHCSRSLLKAIHKQGFTVTINHAFEQVIQHCASVPRNDMQAQHDSNNSTWITAHMILAYQNMHHLGKAHSVEVWHQQQLVGGLYGVSMGAVFCGESMFHLRSNASKVAFHALVQHLRAHEFAFIDCQMQTAHLASLGCIEADRDEFLQHLYAARDQQINPQAWLPQELHL